MPTKAPFICPCGHVVSSGSLCTCRQLREQERKARFDRLRENASTRGYTSKWRRESKAFLAQNPKCECGNKATVVHHIIAHRGDMKLFWRRSNWRAVCKPCHDGPLQSHEKRL